VLLGQALSNILENAIAYSPKGSTITIGYRIHEHAIALFIEDQGPGIARDELDQIFGKFFRGKSDRRRSSGVGLGLSVAKGLIEALDGSLSAISPVSGTIGTRIELTFPKNHLMEIYHE
jgi:two-component system sensor histidine kinase KdpD